MLEKINPFKTPTPVEDFKKFKAEWKKRKFVIALLYFLAGIFRYPLFIFLMIYMILGVVLGIWLFFSSRKIPVSEATKKLHDEYTETKRLYSNNPKSLELKIDSIWKRAISIPVEDKSGRKAIIGIYTLSNSFYWLKGQNKISRLNSELGTSFINYLQSEYFKQGYSKQNEIICVGNSSFEESNIQQEECRSYCRAIYLSELFKKYLPFKEIYILPIGKSDSTSLSSDLQRSIIILGVKKVDTLINMKDALYLHLLKDKNIPFRFWDFSLCKNYDNFYDNSQVPCKEVSPTIFCK